MTNPSSETNSRSKRPRGFRLTDRDREIVVAVYSHRALTTNQIDRLFFFNPETRTKSQTSSQCIRRLKLLSDASLLQRIEQPQTLTEGRKPLVYVLAKRGAALVAEDLGLAETELDWTPTKKLKKQFLDHLISTNDVRIAITQAAKTHDFPLAKWLDDTTLRRRQMKDSVTITGKKEGNPLEVSIIPDGYFVLHIKGYAWGFFLEIDRGTVTGKSSRYGNRDWARKIAAYIAYYHSGKYQARYHSQSYRILTVTSTEARLATLKTVTEQAGGKSWFWFTTFDQATPEAILSKPIWQIAGRQGLQAITS